MDIRSLRSLMEINALQTLGAVQTVAQHGTASTGFDDLLADLLSPASTVQSLSGQSQSLIEGLSYQGMNSGIVPTSINAQTSTPSGNHSWTDIIQQAASHFNVPAKLIESVIQQESGFNAKAVSQAGAAGLMQLMPGTAKFLGVQDRMDPVQNVMGGAKYLRQMLDQFDDRIDLALAAYNAGPGNVKKYGGVPPFSETQNYVKKIMSNYIG